MTAPASTAARGIDPRGPRVVAGLVAITFLVVIALALLGLDSPGFAIGALVLAIYNAAIFLFAAIAGVPRHPYGLIFTKLIRPRLKPPTELEDPTPPTFAQGVGFVVTIVGILFFLPFGSIALVVAGAAAFVAAFLNSAFAYCLGCQIYLLLARAGILGKRDAATA